MDFELDETQRAVTDLADQILTDRSTPERLKEIEAADGFDRETWLELAKAGLVGIAVPEPAGGAGLGLVAAGEVAKAVGRRTAAVPAVGTLAAVTSLVEAGAPIDGVVDGELITVPALDLGPDPSTVRHPSLRAVAAGGGWSLTGELVAVAHGGIADAFVVPASTDDGNRLLLAVDAGADGLTRTGVRTTAQVPSANLRLEGVEIGSGGVLGAGDEVDALVDRVRALTCRAMSGVSQGALALAAAYASEREQFGSKIGTFQAVAHRLADAYIDGQAIELTSLQAAWRIEAGFEHRRALASACFWAAEGGQRIAHATQHVHGGIGVDIDYPQHRHFRWAKDLELQLGGASRALVELGTDLASAPAS